VSVNRIAGTYYGPVGQIDVTDPLGRGLVGWWPMTDVATKTIIDISGRGNHCIMQTGTAVAVGTPWGQGVNFGATANSFGYASAIPGMGSSPYTMSIWARNISQGTSLIMFAFNNNQYMGNIFGGAGNNNWGCAYANGYAQDSGVTSLDQEWHHVVTTVDGSTGSIYVDGLLRASKAIALSDSNANVVIGGWQTGGFLPWNGGLRDARIYNRALRAAEVMALYQQPSRPMVQPRNPMAYASGGTIVLPGAPGVEAWSGGVPNINAKTLVIASNATWGAAGNAAINAKTILSPTIPGAWPWNVNRITPTWPGGSGLGMVTGIVYGVSRFLARGTVNQRRL